MIFKNNNEIFFKILKKKYKKKTHSKNERNHGCYSLPFWRENRTYREPDVVSIVLRAAFNAKPGWRGRSVRNEGNAGSQAGSQPA